MTLLDPAAVIESWHAHLYFDAPGDALADHRDRALWLGRSHVLNLAALGA